MSRRAGRRLLPVILFLGVLPPALSQAPPAPAEPRQLDLEAVTGKVHTDDFDAMLERRVIRFVVPYQPHALLQRQGAGARDRRRHRARLRALAQREVPGRARQAADHGHDHPDHAGRAARERRLRPGRHGRGQHHRHRRPASARRLRRPARPEADRRGGGHRPQVPGHGHARRPGRQDDPSPAQLELPRQRRGARRAAGQGGQAPDHDRRAARRARGRGRAGDAERRAPAACRRRRLEGEDVGADPAGDQGPPRPRPSRRRRGSAGPSGRTARS